MVLVAHAGHWLPTLIFWIGPVLVIAAILLIQKLPGYDPDAEPPLWDRFDDDFSDIAPRVKESRDQL